MSQPVEADILAEVYDLAMSRADEQGQKLAAVARTILFQEAGKTPEDAPAPEGRPPLRPYGQERKRLKFGVKADAYERAQAQIWASGRSVAAALEDGLREYARTGKV